jgi:predicted acyltransferase
LLGVALYYADDRRGGGDTYGLFAIIGAIVVLFAGFDLKQLPRWQRVVVRLLYVGVGAVLLFIVWALAIGP